MNFDDTPWIHVGPPNLLSPSPLCLTSIALNLSTALSPHSSLHPINLHHSLIRLSSLALASVTSRLPAILRRRHGPDLTFPLDPTRSGLHPILHNVGGANGRGGGGYEDGLGGARRRDEDHSFSQDISTGSSTHDDEPSNSSLGMELARASTRPVKVLDETLLKASVLQRKVFGFLIPPLIPSSPQNTLTTPYAPPAPIHTAGSNLRTKDWEPLSSTGTSAPLDESKTVGTPGSGWQRQGVGCRVPSIPRVPKSFSDLALCWEALRGRGGVRRSVGRSGMGYKGPASVSPYGTSKKPYKFDYKPRVEAEVEVIDLLDTTAGLRGLRGLDATEFRLPVEPASGTVAYTLFDESKSMDLSGLAVTACYPVVALEVKAIVLDHYLDLHPGLRRPVTSFSKSLRIHLRHHRTTNLEILSYPPSGSGTTTKPTAILPERLGEFIDDAHYFNEVFDEKSASFCEVKNVKIQIPLRDERTSNAVQQLLSGLRRPITMLKFTSWLHKINVPTFISNVKMLGPCLKNVKTLSLKLDEYNEDSWQFPEIVCLKLRTALEVLPEDWREAQEVEDDWIRKMGEVTPTLQRVYFDHGFSEQIERGASDWSTGEQIVRYRESPSQEWSRATWYYPLPQSPRHRAIRRWDKQPLLRPRSTEKVYFDPWASNNEHSEDEEEGWEDLKDAEEGGADF
ncbi:hypothetical protein NMY22_g13111 [Coprinellus aureogranulatus]|nr:hypothetical protein NMY22_g13111 [Coprinellus aureogranulatus]